MAGLNAAHAWLYVLNAGAGEQLVAIGSSTGGVCFMRLHQPRTPGTGVCWTSNMRFASQLLNVAHSTLLIL